MNPYFCYVFSFALALVVYCLPWSTVYPPLSGTVVWFLLATITLSIATGLLWRKAWIARAMEIPAIDRNTGWVTLFIYVLWILDFIYEGGIPLFKILFNQPYNYRLFGVPSLHVFTVTFSSFYTVYLFHLLVSHRRKVDLVYYLVNLFAAILIYSRAQFVFNLVGSFFILIMHIRRIPFRIFLLSPIVIVVLAYFFGVLGTLRVSRETGVAYDNELFLQTGAASESFRKSNVPNEFFWTYIYITSPLANFQQNTDYFHPDTLSLRKVSQLITNEFLFDFISKRTNKFFGLTPYPEGRIPGPFNVSTVYSRSFWILRWYGAWAMAFLVLILPWIYIKLLPSTSTYFVTGIAILSTMYLFMSYDNTIRFTGLGFQLVYPVVFVLMKGKSLFSLERTG